MPAAALIRRLHEHRMWSNARLLGAARALTDEQLRRAMPIGQGSVWATLTHLMGGDFQWLEALLGNEAPLMPGDLPDALPGNQRGQGAARSPDELATRWDAINARWNDYLASLNDESLDETVYKVSTSSGRGRRFGTTRRDILLHVCTHAQYTAAQLVNMLRRLGVAELPDVMLITLARDEAAAR